MRSEAYEQYLASRETPGDFWESWKHDFELFATEIVRLQLGEERREVLGIDTDTVPFVLNPGQKLLLEVANRKEQQDTSPNGELRKLVRRTRVRAMVLKARQVGSSTFWVLWYLWRCIFHAGTRVAIVAQGQESSETILRIAAFACDSLPKWLFARVKPKVKTASIVFANGSRITAGTANSEFWRGASLEGALLTEVTSYDNLQKTLSAVTRACAGPVVIESTAKGLGMFKEIWEGIRGSWRKVFISWLLDPFCRLDYTDIDPTVEDEQYIQEHKLDHQQRNWYLETKWTEFAGNQKQFDQECPATPKLAFIVFGSKFFYGRNFQYDSRTTPADSRCDWEKPIAGHKYVVGVDVAQGGLENDASTAVLLDVTDLKHVKVASVLQAWLPTPLFSDEVIQMCKDYGNVLACVESNVGLDVIRALRKAGVKQYVRQRDSKMTEQADEYGFWTSQQTRPILMANLTRYVMGNVIQDLRDPRLMEECNNFIYNKHGKPEAASGKRDDLVLGLALAIEGCNQYERLATPMPMPKRPPRPTHDHGAALQWDMKYGYQPKKASLY